MKRTDKSFILTTTLPLFLILVIETMCCAANNNYGKLLMILPSQTWEMKVMGSMIIFTFFLFFFVNSSKLLGWEENVNRT